MYYIDNLFQKLYYINNWFQKPYEFQSLAEFCHELFSANRRWPVAVRHRDIFVNLKCYVAKAQACLNLIVKGLFEIALKIPYCILTFAYVILTLFSEELFILLMRVKALSSSSTAAGLLGTFIVNVLRSITALPILFIPVIQALYGFSVILLFLALELCTRIAEAMVSVFIFWPEKILIKGFVGGIVNGIAEAINNYNSGNHKGILGFAISSIKCLEILFKSIGKQILLIGVVDVFRDYYKNSQCLYSIFTAYCRSFLGDLKAIQKDISRIINPEASVEEKIDSGEPTLASDTPSYGSGLVAGGL